MRQQRRCASGRRRRTRGSPANHEHPVRLGVRRHNQPHHAERECHQDGVWRRPDPDRAYEHDRAPGKVAPSRAGHSIGRWDGDTLVVDTVGFEPGSLAGSVPHSDRLHVVERFTLNPATLELTRGIVTENPVYFADKSVDSDSVLPADAPFRVEACKELAPEYQQTGRK